MGGISVDYFNQIKVRQELLPTTVEIFSGPWLKIRPRESLPAGEYGLVRVLGHDKVDLAIWDFGVNPQPPLNEPSEPHQPGPAVAKGS